MKSVEIDINKIKEKYKGDNKKIAEATMALYKEKKIKPFASILGLIIQIPVFFALYFVFRDGVKLDNNLIYSFIKFPSHVQDLAFGFMNISQKYWILGVLTGISMFILAKRQSSLTGISKDNKSTDFKTVFAKNMQFQMTYFLPIFAGFSTAMFPAVIGIYWTVNNILSIFQDIYIKKQLRKEGLIK
jgi:YidC/Oxa1 family membrane protein insertase